MKKRSKSDRSKTDSGSDSKQRTETPSGLESGKKKLHVKRSEISFSFKNFSSFSFESSSNKSWRLFGLLGLTLVIFGIAIPFIIRSITANLGIPTVIYLAIITIASIVINSVYFKFFHRRQFSRKSRFWNVGLLISCNLILIGTFIFVCLSFLIQLTTSNLGIPKWLSAIIIVLCPITLVSEGQFKKEIYGLQRLNLPLYIVFNRNNKLVYQPWLFWWLKNRQQIKRYIPKYAPKSISKYDPKYVGINVLGGLIPVAVASWQFTRVPIYSLLLIIAVTTVFCYLAVEVVPGCYILIRNHRLYAIVLAIAVLAICIGDRSSTAAIAYGGITIGSLIGADLLHLKDVKPEQAVGNLSIGGAGIKDGIVVAGLYALLTIEFWQQVLVLISSR